MNDVVRILIVEDRPTDAELNEREVRKVLPQAEFLRVDNRDDYLSLLASFRPEVILSDYQLPEFDGLTALRLALEHVPEIPFILVTGSINEETAVECMKAGAWDYILKEHLRRLGPAVVGVLEQKRLRDAHRRAGKTLCESEERYRSLFENNHTVMLLIDPDSGALVAANPAAAAFYGWSREQLCEMKICDITTLSATELRREMAQARAARRNHFHVQQRLADGSIREVEVFSGSIALAGRPLLYAIIHDVSERKKAETGWRLSQFCIDNAAIGIFRIDESGKILEANRQACASLGYSRQELCALTVLDLDPTFSQERWLEHRQQIQANGSGTIETFHRRKDGSIFPVEVTVNYLAFEGEAMSFSFARDISERKRYEDRLRTLSQAVEQSPAAVVLTDHQGDIEYVNPKFTRITGYTLEEVRGKNPRLLRSGECHAEDYHRLWATITAGDEWHGEFHNKRKDGSFFWERASISPVRDDTGAITHFLAVKEDITERKRYEEQLQHLATHDELTGLANRSLLNDRLVQSIHFANRSKRSVGVLLLDLDRFKVVNDSLGHSVGDDLLRSAAKRLEEAVREADTVARLGGDEFAVVLAEVAERDDVGLVARKILDRLTEPYWLQGREITLTASLGISLYPNDGAEGETLLRNADTAMYQAKEEGDTFRFYAPEMNLRVHEILELEADLRRALERGELSLHYQPRVDLATGAMIGAEALLRWQHPLRGMIPPGMFIPLAEEIGLILPIGEWVLATACDQIKAWQTQGLPVVPVAVNLSARQFRKVGLDETVRQILAKSDIDAGLLELELTESMIMRDPQAAAETMRRLKELGVGLALDDFGTGYSSLNYLRRFPVDYLKIDRSFISDAASDPSAAAVATSIVAIAHSLGLHAIAEGVETQEQLDFLRGCGCDSFQGYYFSRPIPAQAFADLLGR